jgi:hypothetical protein
MLTHPFYPQETLQLSNICSTINFQQALYGAFLALSLYAPVYIWPFNHHLEEPANYPWKLRYNI